MVEEIIVMEDKNLVALTMAKLKEAQAKKEHHFGKRCDASHKMDQLLDEIKKLKSEVAQWQREHEKHDNEEQRMDIEIEYLNSVLATLQKDESPEVEIDSYDIKTGRRSRRRLRTNTPL